MFLEEGGPQADLERIALTCALPPTTTGGDMANVTGKELAARMSKRLASFKLSDAAIQALAERVLIDGLEISRFNPCIYGICIDYFTDRMPKLDGLSSKSGISRWDVFPYGIIEWDRFHVRVAFEVPELEGKVPVRGFEH
jgi:hypothetical protein